MATILHLSDLHFGTQFTSTKWDEICHLADSIRPDLVVVTGDLVESPWRWRLARARKALEAFRMHVRACTGRPDLRVVCVPGNHDTRIQGVFPVGWLMPLALVLVLGACAIAEAARAFGAHDFVGALFDHHPARPLASTWEWGWDGAWAAAALLALVATITRLCLSRNLSKALGPTFMLGEPVLLEELGIGLLPFDSASHSLSWARGRVLTRDIVACRRFMDQHAQGTAADGLAPFWLALVHHHPLPLPYDDEFESLMVMDNAGAFLSELAKRRVRLVLHGHKHHQHFARIAIDPASAERVEVAVLSAGTPTRGRRSMVQRHGFNVIRVSDEHRVGIEMYEAEGDGTFAQRHAFDMVPPEEQARWRFERARESAPLSCRRLLCSVEVSELGDAAFAREYRGVRARESVVAFDDPVEVASRSGYLEAFRAESLSAHGPGIALDVTRDALNALSAQLSFKTSGLRAAHGPIDFLLEFQNNNGFALNRWQYLEMYGAQDFTESVQFVMPLRIAVEELLMHLRFEDWTSLPRRIDVRWRSSELHDWLPLAIDQVVRMKRQSALQVTIANPVAGATYQINWDLDERSGVDAVAGGAGRALALRHGLWSTFAPPLRDPAREAQLREVLVAAADEMRETINAEQLDPAYDVAFFVYGDDRRLHCVSSTYPAGDPRRDAAYAFGLGMAGRAFKACDTVTFVRPHDLTRVMPSGYVTCANTAPASALEIPEHVIVAFALAPDEAQDWPFAVLQISTDRIDTQLSKAVLDRSPALQVMTEVLAQTLPEVLEAIIDPRDPANGRAGP